MRYSRESLSWISRFKNFHFPKQTATIAMHIRHRNHGYTNQDDEYLKVLKKLLLTKYHGKECRLLLASDWPSTIITITNNATALGCKVYTTPKDMSNACMNTSHPDCNEQGPWRKGVVQMADVYLLSHSQYFIGNGGSTFAQSIGYLMSYVKSQIEPEDHGQYMDFIISQTLQCCMNGNKCSPVCPAEAVQRLKLPIAVTLIILLLHRFNF